MTAAGSAGRSGPGSFAWLDIHLTCINHKMKASDTSLRDRKDPLTQDTLRHLTMTRITTAERTDSSAVIVMVIEEAYETSDTIMRREGEKDNP